MFTSLIAGMSMSVMHCNEPSCSSTTNEKSKSRHGNKCVVFGCSNTAFQGVILHKFPWKRDPNKLENDRLGSKLPTQNFVFDYF